MACFKDCLSSALTLISSNFLINKTTFFDNVGLHGGAIYSLLTQNENIITLSNFS